MNLKKKLKTAAFSLFLCLLLLFLTFNLVYSSEDDFESPVAIVLSEIWKGLSDEDKKNFIQLIIDGWSQNNECDYITVHINNSGYAVRIYFECIKQTV